jgi:hypothetical protein
MRFRTGARRRFNRLAVLGVLSLATAGCTNPFALPRGPTEAAGPAIAPAAAADPVAAFAATASPGAETVALVPDAGGRARLRLLRSYTAASGRECREVLIGTGLAERSRVVCRGDAGWTPARPLLRGGGGRP